MRFGHLIGLGLGLVASGCISSTPEAPHPGTDGGVTGDGGGSGGFDGGTVTGIDGGAPVTTACTPATGPGTTHGTSAVTADTLWLAADNPHVVTYGLQIAKGATLTLGPCVEVRMKGGYGISVAGRLVADGTASQPIHIGPDDAATPWGDVGFVNGGTGRFAYATLENGGNDTIGLGLIDVRGDTTVPGRQEIVRLDHVTLKTSQTYGLSLSANGTLTADSDALTITGAAKTPVRTWPGLAGNIPAGTYTGNAVDEFEILAEDSVNEDTTWHAWGVPVHVGNPVNKNGADLRVGKATTGAPKVTLTVEAGLLVKVAPTGRIRMSASSTSTTGVLVARGAEGKRIVFTSTSATPVPGDWAGLWFDGPDPGNVVDHVDVNFAGGPSYAENFHCSLSAGGVGEPEDASILIFGEPPAVFVTNTVITSGAAYGIGRAWTGAALDFLPTNTFQQLGRCKESYPRPPQGACPSPVPCP